MALRASAMNSILQVPMLVPLCIRYFACSRLTCPSVRFLLMTAIDPSRWMITMIKYPNRYALDASFIFFSQLHCSVSFEIYPLHVFSSSSSFPLPLFALQSYLFRSDRSVFSMSSHLFRSSSSAHTFHGNGIDCLVL